MLHPFNVFSTTFYVFLMMSEMENNKTKQKNIAHKWKQIRMENLVCKLNVSNSMVLCFSVTPEDRSIMTSRLEPYPRKKRVFGPLQTGNPFLTENCGMPERGPCVFAGNTMPLGSGPIVLESEVLPSCSPNRK